MSTEQNKSIVRRWVENGWNKGNLALVDELYTPDYTLHDAQATAPVNSAAAFKQYVMSYRTAMPDLHFAIDDLVAEGDKVAWRFTARGTQTGPLGTLPPTGKKAVVTGTVTSRFTGGKWCEDYINLDVLGMMQQLGVIPMMA